ncbi:hypothetical protein GCM10023149_11540 [Mucilaginibacter gynuensis]|uniref:PliI/PliC-like inhibitor of I-type lysozyme n=1 Tax=Mucilaginibacter gynuensis TaxID=1302236 RepID=A0ABP8G113_9SPHI
MNARFILGLLTAGVLAAGCGNDDKKPVNNNAVAPKKPTVQAPFRFHKRIEVAPGQDFDVLSWGRGSSDVGSFLILHSDSAGMDYTTTTGNLEGSIVDVYNSDMDLDGNPELLIQGKAKDSTNYANVYAFEFNGDRANKLDFPKLTKKQRKGYRGNDNFYIKEGKLMREFPIYDGEGAEAKPSGAKRVFEYGLRNNSFTVDQLSKDSTAKDEPKQAVANQPKQEEKTEKKSEVRSSSSKKKRSSSSSSRSSKKRRRHRN